MTAEAGAVTDRWAPAAELYFRKRRERPRMKIWQSWAAGPH